MNVTSHCWVSFISQHVSVTSIIVVTNCGFIFQSLISISYFLYIFQLKFTVCLQLAVLRNWPNMWHVTCDTDTLKDNLLQIGNFRLTRIRFPKTCYDTQLSLFGGGREEGGRIQGQSLSVCKYSRDSRDSLGLFSRAARQSAHQLVICVTELAWPVCDCCHIERRLCPHNMWSAPPDELGSECGV